MIYREGSHGPETHTTRTFQGDKVITLDEPNVTAEADQEALDVEYVLPPVDLYLPSDEGEGIVTNGWKGIKTDFNPETGQMETTVEKNGVTKVISTEELDDLQNEMWKANRGLRASMGEKALQGIVPEAPSAHIHVVDANPDESRVKVHFIHGAQEDK